jgi:hypothetical protein
MFYLLILISACGASATEKPNKYELELQSRVGALESAILQIQKRLDELEPKKTPETSVPAVVAPAAHEGRYFCKVVAHGMVYTGIDVDKTRAQEKAFAKCSEALRHDSLPCKKQGCSD